eukprot:4645512-Amphidinium_carterae.1
MALWRWAIKLLLEVLAPLGWILSVSQKKCFHLLLVGLPVYALVVSADHQCQRSTLGLPDCHIVLESQGKAQADTEVQIVLI